MDRFQFLVTVNVFLIEDNKLLLIRRANTGFFDNHYEGPSGHMDGNETVQQAAARETLEEVGMTIKPADLKVVHVVHRYGEKNERIEFYLIANTWKGEPTNMEPDQCDDVAWFPLDALPQMVPKTKAALEHYLAGNLFSEDGWDKST